MTFKQELLGKYVKVIGGFAFKSEHFTEEGVPIVRISDIQGGTVSVDRVARIPEAFIGKGERYAIEPGDILIAMSGATTGKIGLVPQNVNGLILQNQRVGNFKVTTPEKIHKSYLKHFVCSTAYQRQIFSTMAGAAQPNISSKQLENIKIPIPPLSEQQRIAAILDQADGLRAKRREALAQLDSLTQSIFIEMFGDPATNPKRWVRQKLGEITLKITDGEHLNPKFSQVGMPIIMAGNVLEDSVDIASSKKVEASLGERFRKKCNPEIGDLLVVSRGATIGRMCALNVTDTFCLMGSVILIKLLKEEIDSIFLSTLLKHPVMRSALYKTSGSSAQQAIYLKDLKSLTCIVPPIKLQMQFSEQAKAIDKIKTVHRASLDEIDSLFASLQHRAFRGEL